MKPRPFRPTGSWANFICRILVVVILLQGISAHPIPDRRPPPPFLEGHYQILEQRPPLLYRPPPYPSDRLQKAVVPEKPKTAQPVFFSYTVPIPWPTPFNGTDFVSIPSTTHPVVPVSSELPSDDTYPLYIPLPQFEYVPLYHIAPVAPTTPQPSITQPTHPTCPPPTNVAPPAKPVSKPPSVRKPVPRPIPLEQTGPIPPSTKPHSTNVLVKQPSTKPKQPTSTPPPTKPTSTKNSLQPPQTKSRFLDPICDDLPPPNTKLDIPRPKHTWVPPPENVPDYIPPPPSVLHPRSSVSHYGKNPHDSITYEPEYYTVSDDTPDISYSPEYYTISDDTPEAHSHYYPYDLPYRYRPSYYDRYYPASLNRPPYVTYGPEIITYTEPPRYGSNDGYYTYGPNIVTYRENAPVPTYPVRTPFTWENQPPSRRPTPSSEQSVTIGGRSSAAAFPPPHRGKQPPSRTPTPHSEQPVTIGGRSSAPAEPQIPQQEEELDYVYYDPEIYTVIDDDEKTATCDPSRQPTPTPQQPVTIGGKPSASAGTQTPKQEGENGYVYYEPEFFTIVDGDDEKAVFYEPEIVRVHEVEPQVVGEQPGEPDLQDAGIKSRY